MVLHSSTRQLSLISYWNMRQPDLIFHHSQRLLSLTLRSSTQGSWTWSSPQYEEAGPDPSLQHKNTETNREVFSISARSPVMPPKRRPKKLGMCTLCLYARVGYQWDIDEPIQSTHAIFNSLPCAGRRTILPFQHLSEDRGGQCTSTKETFGYLRVLYWVTYIA